MEKEQIEKVNKLFYLITESLKLEEIENLVDKLKKHLFAEDVNKWLQK